jgi:benzoylformate decarboxylase
MSAVTSVDPAPERAVSVKDALAEVFERREVELIFGNPGSTELPFLAGLPPTVRYVMALQEASVAAMATGYALRTGKTPIISVHTGPGLGNAAGAIFNLLESRVPAIVVVGQQDSRHLRDEPVLSADLVAMGRPLTKWAYQPVAAADVPMAFEKAFRVAESGTPGPVLLSVPMNFFEGPADPAPVSVVRRPGGLGAELAGEIADDLRAADKIALVTGARVEMTDAWDSVIALAETLDATVYGAPFQSMPGFPTRHPLFKHGLPVTRAAIGRLLAPYSHVVTLGVPAFKVYPYSEGRFLAEGARLTAISDVSGDLTGITIPGAQLIEASIGPAARDLVEQLGAGDAVALPARPTASLNVGEPSVDRSPVTVGEACRLIIGMCPEGAVLADESVSSAAVVAKQWRTAAPRTHLRTASGGLGFAIPAAVGAALAGDAPLVLCIIGDGSFPYSVQGLWTAAQHELPVKVVVLRNGGYKVLADYHESVSEHLGDLPSMEVPGVDAAQLAGGFGVPGRTATTPAELAESLEWLYSTPGPALLEIAVEWSAKSMFR